VYHWRIERLKKQLSAAPLSDREILPYAVTNGAMFGLGLALPPENPNRWDTVAGLVTMLVMVFGILWVYRQNGGHAGRDFLQRYVAISWVAFVRLVPVALLAGIALLIIKGTSSEPTAQTTPPDVLFSLGVAVAYYQRIGAHVRQVSRGLPSNEQGMQSAI
jgi:hypothetical protein